MELMIKVKRNDLCDILGVGIEAIKKIEKNNTLEERLKEVGYHYVKKEKEGRSNVYILVQMEENKDKKLLTCMIKNIYGTDKYLTFSEYFTIRYVFAKTKWRGASAKKISEYVGVSQNTISRWDNLMRSNNMILADGFYYYKKDFDTGKEIEITEYEYKSFWENKRHTGAMKRLKTKFEMGKIDIDEYTVAILEKSDILRALEGKYCYKVKKYIINELNVLNKDIFNLIKKIYLTDIGLEYLCMKQ